MRVLNTTNKPRKWINVEHFQTSLEIIGPKISGTFLFALATQHLSCKM